MKFIEFDSKKCDSCFKCLRVCPTKAIAFSGTRRQIVDDLCIKCGLCQAHCGPGALKIHLDIKRVKDVIASGKRVVASLAPSFVGAFRMSEAGKMVGALKSLGFDQVEETAHGAEIISRHYEMQIQGSDKANIITSCCPSANYLVEHYYPDAVDSVIPVVSPMLAHGRDIRSRFGEDVYIVFIGPCLAKKAEAVEIGGSIDAVITFTELDDWIRSEGIALDGVKPMPFDHPVSRRGRAYPLGGSLWRSDLKTRINPKYKYIHVDGFESCQSFLDAVSNEAVSGYCAEINICSGSCLNGPDMPAGAPSFYERQSYLSDYVDRSLNEMDDLCDSEEYHTKLNVDLDVNRGFTSKPTNLSVPSDEAIMDILLQMDKYSDQDQLNCGACGYSTCHDKAVAVFHGYSDVDMCMDALKKKAESLQSIIFENSPNAICILDEEQRIKEVNPSFHNIFNEQRIKLVNWPIYAIMSDEIFQELSESEEVRISRKVYMEMVDRFFYCNIVKLDDGDLYVGIFTDITAAEKSRTELDRVKEETVSACQEVIEKQMRVAQEIASLLGETTAETKIGLNKLKSIVLNDNGGM